MSRRTYTAEFKEQAVQLVLKKGYSITEAARELGIADQTLSNWVQRRKDRPAEPVASADSNDPQVLKAKIRELEGRLRRAEMEKEILKKATAFFAKENP
jgi:transposase